ncbi:unnamed protein product [Cuscuta campestris]|uniref:Thioredoxin-like fold domain-containing protein n=1 Tax=Cuscuta campestris TaxID=132261 RepID=A0A484N123_9ASTE|nr:unnamed protein product [Cuscuta campestris]
MAEQARKPMPHHMFFPLSGYRNPLPLLETHDPEPREKIFPRMSDDIRDIKEDNYIWHKKNVDVVELLKGHNRDFLIKKKKKGETETVCVPIEQELKGCYVIVACFLAPILSASTHADPCHALIRLFEEVSAQRLDPECKTVIVTKVTPCAREIWMDKNVEEVAFDEFFSGFPEGFLAIPFSDFESRDRVFSSLSETKQPFIAALIVDPDGKVLHRSFGYLCSYGAAFYPFSMDHVNRLSMGDEWLKRRLNPFPYQVSPSLDYESPLLSLAQLFNHFPEDVLLAEIRGQDMVNPAPLSTLMKGQLVALYLCANGHFMDSLVKLYLQCRERVPKLEVVVVPLAFSDYPQSYYHHIMLALAKRNITTWWALHPYNDKIMRTLSRLSGRRGGDRLILVPAVGENYSYCGDFSAHAVLSLLKVYPRAYKVLPPSMYPFTTEKLYIERLSSLRQVTLPSLLCCADLSQTSPLRLCSSSRARMSLCNGVNKRQM